LKPFPPFSSWSLSCSFIIFLAPFVPPLLVLQRFLVFLKVPLSYVFLRSLPLTFSPSQLHFHLVSDSSITFFHLALFPLKSIPLAFFFALYGASYPLLQKYLSRLIFLIQEKVKHNKSKPKLQAPSKEEKTREAKEKAGSPKAEDTREKWSDEEGIDKGKAGEKEGKEVVGAGAGAGAGKGKVAAPNDPKIHPLGTFLAGCISGLAIFLDVEPHGRERRVTLALYFFVRAAEVAFTSAVERGWCPYFPHTDTLLFVCSCTEIMYSWFYTPETLPRAYVGWISKMANMDSRLLEFLREKRLGNIQYGSHSDVLAQYAIDHGFDPSAADPENGFINCVMVGEFIFIFFLVLIGDKHPKQQANLFFLFFVKNQFLTSIFFFSFSFLFFSLFFIIRPGTST